MFVVSFVVFQYKCRTPCVQAISYCKIITDQNEMNHTSIHKNYHMQQPLSKINTLKHGSTEVFPKFFKLGTFITDLFFEVFVRF
jgi:hypothetical protein